MGRKLYVTFRNRYPILMKRTLLLLVLISATLISCAQSVVNRSGAANTVSDYRLQARHNFFAPRYTDTAAANAQKGIDSCGAIIYTYDVDGFWFRECFPAKRWVRFGDVDASGSVTNLTIINDSSVRICTGDNACDTLNFDTHITNISSSFFLSDSAIVVCNTGGACDTVQIPRQPLYVFQNALTRTGDITEWGGPLVHNTTVDAGYYSVFFSGATLQGYPYRFYQQQGHQGSTGIVSFERAGNYTAPSSVALGVHGWDYTRQNNAEAFIPGYFGRRTGYALVTNFQSSQRPGWAAVAPDTSSKVSGLFLNTDDGDKNTEAFTLFGLAESALVGDQVRDSLAAGKILTGHTNKNLTFWGYDSTARNDGALTKVLGTDADGNVLLGTLSATAIAGATAYTANNGLTMSGTTNQLGGTLLKNTTINTTSAYGLTITGANPTSATLQVQNNSSSQGISSSSISGTGVYARSTTNTGLAAYSETSIAGVFGTGDTSVSTEREVVKLQVEPSSGTPAAGLGGYLATHIKAGTMIKEASRVGTKWSDAGLSTHTAQWEVSLAQGGISPTRRLALSGAGKLTLDTYGDGLHTGTPTRSLLVDADGNVIEGALSGVTADNGLTAVGANVQLGGTLIQGTTIAANTQNFIITSTSTTHGLQVTNSASGNALYLSADSGKALVASASASNPAIDAIASAGPALTGTTVNSVVATLNIGPADGGSVQEVLRLSASPTVTAAAGLGSKVTFYATTTAWVGKEQGSLQFGWTDATDATRTSQFELWGTQSATNQALLRISGAGVFTLVRGLPDYADNAAAIAGGLTTNQLYRTGGTVKIVTAP
jgi:hypothetical protein